MARYALFCGSYIDSAERLDFLYQMLDSVDAQKARKFDGVFLSLSVGNFVLNLDKKYPWVHVVLQDHRLTQGQHYATLFEAFSKDFAAIMLIDDDDMLMPDALAVLAKDFETGLFDVVRGSDTYLSETRFETPAGCPPEMRGMLVRTAIAGKIVKDLSIERYEFTQKEAKNDGNLLVTGTCLDCGLFDVFFSTKLRDIVPEARMRFIEGVVTYLYRVWTPYTGQKAWTILF